MKTGIYHGIPFNEYRDIDAINFSTLKHMAKSPAVYKKMLGHVSSSKSMDIGRAVHVAVLEPELFAGTYNVYDGHRRGKAWTEFKEDNEGLEIITRSEYNDIMTIKAEVLKNQTASRYLSNGRAEVTVIFNHASTGLLCKARIDYVNEIDDCGYMTDLKTSKSVEHRVFLRQAESLLYYMQMAFYRNGYYAVTGQRLAPKTVAVENTYPNSVRVFNIVGDTMNVGQNLVTQCMERLVRCQETDEWPDDSEEEYDLTLSPWAIGSEQQKLIIGGSEVYV